MEADFSFSAQQLRNMPVSDFDAQTSYQGNSKINDIFRQLTKSFNHDWFANLTEQEVQGFLDAFQEWVMQGKGNGMPSLGSVNAQQSPNVKKLLGQVLTTIKPEMFKALNDQELQLFFQKFEQWIDVLRFQASKGVVAQNTVNVRQGVGG